MHNVNPQNIKISESLIGIEAGCNHENLFLSWQPEACGVRDLPRAGLLVALHRRVVEHVLDVAVAGLARRQQLPEVADAVNVLTVHVLELTALEPKREAPVEERVL